MKRLLFVKRRHICYHIAQVNKGYVLVSSMTDNHIVPKNAEMKNSHWEKHPTNYH